MNKNFFLHCILLLLGGVTMAASIALTTFVLFALGDSIFATGRAL
jgi:hypothetical protein